MKLEIDVVSHPHLMVFLPAFFIQELTCGECLEVHGWSFELGFGFWTLRFLFYK